MQNIIVAQLGARMHYAVPEILYSYNLLAHFYTDICISKGWLKLLKLIPKGLIPSQIKQLIGREPNGIPSSYITSFNEFGLEYAFRRSKASNPSEISSTFLWASDRFCELVIKGGFKNQSAVYGFNSASEKLFIEAKGNGLKLILEQTIAPKITEIRLLEEEASHLGKPELNIQDTYAEKFAEREKHEWMLADQIICPSEFVQENVIAAGASPEKCFIIPYGVRTPNFQYSSPKIVTSQSSKKDVLTVLFVGNLGLRKGVLYLLEAMQKLQGMPIQCRIVGSGLDATKHWLYTYASSNVEFVGLVPRSEMIYEYAQADIFCLPSLCEGSATVIYEALAAGLPVITTQNSGSIVRDGLEGFIVPIRNSDAIAGYLEHLISDSALLEEMSAAALHRSQYGSFEAYADRFVKTFSGYL